MFLYIPKNQYSTIEEILKYYNSAYKIVEAEKAFLLFPLDRDYHKFKKDIEIKQCFYYD